MKSGKPSIEFPLNTDKGVDLAWEILSHINRLSELLWDHYSDDFMKKLEIRQNTPSSTCPNDDIPF